MVDRENFTRTVNGYPDSSETELKTKKSILKRSNSFSRDCGRDISFSSSKKNENIDADASRIEGRELGNSSTVSQLKRNVSFAEFTVSAETLELAANSDGQNIRQTMHCGIVSKVTVECATFNGKTHKDLMDDRDSLLHAEDKVGTNEEESAGERNANSNALLSVGSQDNAVLDFLEGERYSLDQSVSNHHSGSVDLCHASIKGQPWENKSQNRKVVLENNFESYHLDPSIISISSFEGLGMGLEDVGNRAAMQMRKSIQPVQDKDEQQGRVEQISRQYKRQQDLAFSDKISLAVTPAFFCRSQLSIDDAAEETSSLNHCNLSNNFPKDIQKQLQNLEQLQHKENVQSQSIKVPEERQREHLSSQDMTGRDTLVVKQEEQWQPLNERQQTHYENERNDLQSVDTDLSRFDQYDSIQQCEDSKSLDYQIESQKPAQCSPKHLVEDNELFPALCRVRKRLHSISNGDLSRHDDACSRNNVKSPTENNLYDSALQTLESLMPFQMQPNLTLSSVVKMSTQLSGIARSKLSETAFRKLEQQVVDVRENGKNKFRVENYQKLYRLNGITPGSSNGMPSDLTSDPDSQPYHEQLHSSLQAFQIRKWRPLTPDLVPQPSFTRCRPVSGRPVTSQGASYSALTPHRPYSEPVSSRPLSRIGSALLTRRPDTPRVDPGNFDTLSPRILCHLVTDPRPVTPNSSYGDIISGRSQRSKMKTASKEETKGNEFEDLDSYIFQNKDDESEDLSDGESNDSDDDSISELEKGNEPPVDSNRRAPDLNLRPERLDHVYTPENKRDMKRFDFDAEKNDVPLYEFECPIPTPFNKINFRYHAREKNNWRFSSYAISGADPELSAMFDRLVEIEKRQIDTEEWEERRFKQIRKRPVSRVASANKPRDKRCCYGCLQPACVGDCPNKRVPPNCCEKCHQPLCTGTCGENKYEQRMRQPREETGASLPPRPHTSRNCKPCLARHNAKYINANQVVLGRPKSAFSTYSRGKSSSKPKDLRPKSAYNISEHLSEGIEKIGLEPLQPTPPGTVKPARPRSRNGVIPGKSCFSNLNRSLTELSTKRRRSAKTRKRET